MRHIININKDWIFVKDTTDISRRDGEQVNLPHSWNAVDGQDGGNDYFRGANSTADVYVGGEKIAHHDGGYSTWRVNITDKLTDETEIAVLVGNAPNDTVSESRKNKYFDYDIHKQKCLNAACGNKKEVVKFDLLPPIFLQYYITS